MWLTGLMLCCRDLASLLNTKWDEQPNKEDATDLTEDAGGMALPPASMPTVAAVAADGFGPV